MKTARQKERELIINLHKKGKSCREVAKLLDMSKSKASFWINRFKETGSLENRQRSGRPTLLTKKALSEIHSAISSQMLAAEGKTGIRTKEVLQLIENKINKKYTLRHAERILHKLDFALVTPRTHHIRKDPVAQDNFRHNFKKNLRKNIWVAQ